MNSIQEGSNITMCFGKAGLVAGTTTTISTATAITYAIAGKAYAKGATANIATPTTDARTGAAFTAIPVGTAAGGYACAFLVCLDTSAAVKVLQGEIVGTTSGAVASSVMQDASEFGSIPDGLCPIGYVLTKTDSAASAWTFGTSNLTGPPTGVTHTYVDLVSLPGRPVSA